MIHRLRTLALAALLTTGSAIGVVAAAPTASADTQICDQFGSTTIQSKYVVQNNRWGTSAQQCINVTSTGFSITTQQGVAATNGAPTAYPSIYLGCHYTNCSPGSPLPMQLSQIGSVPSSISYAFVSGATYDAAYDIWLDPTPKTNGVNQTEIMIWFNRQGSIQPVGSQTGTATVGGRGWAVWTGNNGANNVVSYVAPAPIPSWSFNVLDFINDTKSRGFAQSSWFLTSVQAGFEPWQGGVGLGVSSFSTSVTGGGGGGGGGGTPGVSCAVSYTKSQWTGGFTGNVMITNGSASAVNGWTLAWTFPGDSKVTSAWNAQVTQSGTAVTARDAGFNASIGANGGTQSFGFQGTWSANNASPTAFSLNGTACTVS
jgi:hypothetical protein